MTRLAVVGAGRIGGEVAYLATILEKIDELVLHDASAPLLKAQILDLLHTGTDIPILSDTRAIRDADICVFSAGFPRTPLVKTRADLLTQNIPILKEWGALLDGFSGILITITNPMDANNFLMAKLAELPRERCIGFGGQLDSVRFGIELAERGIRENAWVLGEHGEYQVPVFSRHHPEVPVPEREEILKKLRGASMPVIMGKGGTVFGPARHIVRLIDQVIEDRRELLPCSCILEGEYGVHGCALGVPARIGRNGLQNIEEWKLDSWESAKFREAAEFEQNLVRSVIPGL